MRVLVTGGAGFIGSHTVDALLAKGHEVRILDNLQKPVHLKGKPGWVPDETEFVLGDVRDKAMWERCLEGVEAVYHFAAYQDYLPDFSTFFHVNAVSTALLYEVAVEKGLDLAKVVVASSQFVQGEGLYRCRRSEVGGRKEEKRSADYADYAEKKCFTPQYHLPELRGKQRRSRNTGEDAEERGGGYSLLVNGGEKKGVNGYSLLVTGHKDKRVTRNDFSRITNQRITNNESTNQQITNNAAKRCGVFAGEIRAEEQLKRGEWEMLCPVCGEPGDWQWTPETHVAPPNAYAMAKYSQEMQSMTFGKRYGIPSVALRYSIVQGPRQSFYNAYSGACRIFSLSYYFGKAPTVYEDGKQCRDFVNIHDVVRANVIALEDERMDYGVFNVGGGKAYTVKDFAEIVKEQMSEVRGQKSEKDRGRRSEVGSRMTEKLPEPKVPGFYRFGDTRNACSDISKIRALGWEPEMTPRDSVKEYVAWLYEQDNVEDILAYAEKTMKEMNVVRRAEVTG